MTLAAASAFEPPLPAVIDNVSVTNGSFCFSFAGIGYWVEHTADLSLPNWIQIHGTETNSSNYFCDSVIPNASRFYQLNKDTVYSANRVGYINRSFTAGTNPIAMPLWTWGGNRLDEVLPTVPEGTVIYKAEPTRWDSSVYVAGVGWRDGRTHEPSTMTLRPGEGAVMVNPIAMNVTFAGEVPQGGSCNCFPAGLSLISASFPRSGRITTDLGFPAQDGDTIYLANPANGGALKEYFYFDDGGWGDEFGFVEPVIGFGQPFWLWTSSSRNWCVPGSGQMAGACGNQNPGVPACDVPWAPNFDAPGEPTILLQPLSQALPAGTNVTFTADACGTPPLNYRWRFNGIPISGATNSHYSRAGLVSTNAGGYSVVVSNAFGAVTSVVAMLTVTFPPPPAPYITQIQVAGGTASFTFTTFTDSRYRVLYKDDLASADWQALTGLIPGTGAPVVVSDSSAFNLSRFYRVVDWDHALYSSNVVGYVNIAVSPPWNLIANPFRFSHSNRVQDVIGAYSLPDDSLMLKVRPPGFECALFYSGELLDCDTGDPTMMTLSPGEGSLLYTEEFAATITFVGEVLQGSLTNKLPAGLSLCSSVVPQTGLISSHFGFPVEAGDVFYKFHQPTQSYRAHTYLGAGAWDPVEPIIAVGEAFWVELGSSREWVRQFSAEGAGGGAYTVTNLPYVGAPHPLVPGRTPPEIIAQPQSRTNLVGTAATFSVSASGSPLLGYQWRLGTTTIPGATNVMLNLPNVQPADAGAYRIVITNAFGSVTSAPANLTVTQPPSAPILHIQSAGNTVSVCWTQSAIGYQMEQATVIPGPWSPVTAPASVSGGMYCVTAAISGASRFYRLHAPGGPLAYSSNVVGYVNVSIAGNINVIGNPFQRGQNRLREVLPQVPEWTTNLKVGISGLDCFYFDGLDWRDCDTDQLSSMTLSPGEGAILESETPATITFIGDVLEGALTNKLPAGLSLCSSIVPRPATITGLGFPAEAGDTIYQFDRLSQSYRVHTCLGAGNWEPAEPVISVAEGFWVELGRAKDWVTHFSVSEPKASAYAVTNRPYVGDPDPRVPPPTPPEIIAQPQSRTNLVGTAATFSVSAAGSPPLRYQWLFGGAAIAGATNPTHTVFNIQLTNGGNYSVVVSNAFGSTNSDNATLTVVAEALYTAVVQTDVNVAPAGTPVLLIGQATYVQTGEPAAFKPVQIHILVQGTERIIATTTDFAGQFSVTFVPLATEVGHYEVVASPSGVNLAIAAASPEHGARFQAAASSSPLPPGGWMPQDAFDLVDLRFIPARPSHRVPALTAVTNRVVVTNVSHLAITGIAVTTEAVPSGILEVEVPNPPDNVPPTTGHDVTYILRSLTDASWQGTVTVVLTDALGLRAELPVQVTVAPAHPQLVAVPAQLEAGMIPGQPALVEFEVRNVGGRDTGPIAVGLPSQFAWLHVVTPSPLPSLGPDQSTKVALQLLPETGLAVGDYTNAITLNYSNAFLAVPFIFRSLSDATGAVLVTVEDEYTYYAEGNPRVANARVTLTDAIDGNVARTGFTGSDGRLSLTGVREGYYHLEVNADRHESFRATIRVRPGQTRSVVAFLSREMVIYYFSVEGTHVDGRVRIGVETVFETFVPAPVVTISPVVIDLASLTNDTNPVMLMITNHGLVAAQDLQLSFDPHPCWKVELRAAELGLLAAQTNLAVPINIIRLSEPSTNNLCGPCEFYGRLAWSLPTGPVVRARSQTITLFNACYPPAPPAPPILSGGGRTSNGPGPDPGPGGGPGGDDGGDDEVQRHDGGDHEDWQGDEYDGGGDGSFPARVQLRLEPTVVVGLNAFRARLDILNPLPTPITNLATALALSDPMGADASNRFIIHPAELRGVTSLSGGTIAGNSTGSVSWVFIPTPDAAPAGPAAYYVGGTLGYGHEGYNFHWELGPVGIRVLPTPRLTVNLFHERDVYSDDPVTTGLIEPAVPFPLAALIRNLGPVSANNVRLEAPEVEIVSNEQGLLIDFQLVQSQVGTAPASDGLTLNFGTLTNGQIAIGRWLMTASLQGLFTSYEATLVYSDDLGARQLAPIEDVGIHELIRLVKDPRAGADALPDFLVNDLPDPPWDLPDTLYLSDGGTNDVTVSTNGVFSDPPTPGQLLVTLIQAVGPGWTYSRLPDPGNGNYLLVAVERSDGALLPTNNFWQTDRVFVEGQAPIKTSLLHFLDYNSTGLYTLHYAMGPDVDAPSSRVTALPTDSPPNFTVNWSGADDSGVGIAFFDVYVSVDGAAASNWLAQTTATNAIFNASPGHCYAFYSVATDYSGNQEAPPGESDAETCVAPSNRPPVLDQIANVTLVEGITLDLTVLAGDPDLPGDLLTYSLAAGPLGATIHTNTGRLIWPTSETDGGSSNFFRVVVTDTGLLSDIRTFVVLVLESNSPPTLAPVTNRTIRAGQTLSLAVTATDADLPPDLITYSLSQGPAGADLDPITGLLTWTASHTNVGANVAFTVRASDPGQLSDAVSFLVFVEPETNLPPELDPIATRHVIAGSCVYVTNSASDANLPEQTLRFALCDGMALNATVDPVSGLFTWCPAGGLAGTSNRFCVCVSDDGNPSLSATQCFAVVVHELPQLRLGRTVMRVNESDSVPLTLAAAPGFARLAFRLTIDPADGLTNLVLTNLSTRLTSAVVVEMGAGSYLVRLEAKPGQTLVGTEKLCDLGFTALPADSKFIWLRIADVVGEWPGGSQTGAVEVEDGRVVVVGRKPLLEVQVSTDAQFSFTLYGNSGSNYVLEASSGLESTANWQNAFPTQIPGNTLFQNVTNLDRGGSHRFYRARE